jgi:UDP-glucose:(heptosyl)LPS alpha-1,3-glucosyltransferase
MAKNIVLLKSNFNKKGGLEKYAWRTAKAFAAKGIVVDILTTGKKEEFPVEKQIRFHPFQTCFWPGFRRIEQYDQFCKRWTKNNPCPLIFGMDRNRFQTHLRAGNGAHISYLSHRAQFEGSWKKLLCQLNPLHKTILKIEKESFENPNLQKLITNSYMVKEEILHYYNIDEKKISVIHNGVEWEEKEKDFLQWEEQKKRVAQKWRLDPNVFHFLFIGHGYLRKGLKPLLQALQLLPRKDFHLSVIGKEKKMKEFFALSKKLGLEKNVRFFGPLEEILPFYQLADCLVIPSFYDPFANVTVEALSMGIFVVSSKTNGGHEILSNTNGTIIETVFDPDSIQKSLLFAMEHRKTQKNAQTIRKSIQHLDFSKQLDLLIQTTLNS